MCEPTTVMAVGSAVVGGISSYAQVQAQNAQARAEEQAARDAYSFDMAALADRDLQIQQELSRDAFERQRQAVRDRSMIAVAAGEAGVSGNTIMRQMAQSFLKESYDTGITRQSAENAFQASQLQAQRVWATRESRINQAQAKQINPFLGSLMVGSSAAQGYYSAPKIGG